MQVALSFIIYIIAILGATFILFNNHQKATKQKLSILLLLAIIFFCFLYKLCLFPNVFLDEANGFYDAYSLAKYGVDSHLIKFPIYLQSYAGQGQSILCLFPNVFLDEANGFYDAYSLAKYGVDSHLIKFPIYLQSYAGQGQSILLAYISILFFKLFGFSLFSFRLSLVVVAIVAILFTCYTLNQYYSKFLAPVMLSLCSAPYLTVEARYGMDCNISLWISLIIINCLLIGIKAKRPLIPITLFYIFCGILAYSYNVAWIYLAFSIVSISILLYKEKIIVPKVIILGFMLLSIEILPIVIFAIRSNIRFFNRTIRFGIFTIPELPMSRANASFIDFHGNVLKNILNNVFSGFRMLFLTSDGLTWNSLPNFNAYYPFAIIIFIIGLYWVLKNYKSIEAKALIILLLCNIPIWLIVQPNYNHWIFTHIPILLTIGVGIKILEKVIPYKYLYGVYLLFFLLFSHAYFTMPRYTGFDISSIKNVKYIRKVSEGSNVYFDGNDRNLLLVIRDFSGISPYEFQRTKDNPYSRKRLLFYNNMANYHKVNTESNIRKGELFLTTNRNISKKEFKLQKSNIYIGDTLYCLYRRIN